MRAAPDGRTAVLFVQPAYLMTDGRMYLPQCLGKFWIYEICGPFRATIAVFQDEAPLLRKHTHPARTQTRTLWPSTWLLLKAMGAGPCRLVTYAAGRLDGIGRRAIRDMVSSAVASS
jgi:hypothetical protein